MGAAMRSVRPARHWLPVFVLAGTLARCASVGEVQRATQGPTADEVWQARFAQGDGRLLDHRAFADCMRQRGYVQGSID